MVKKSYLATDTSALCKNQVAISDQQIVFHLKVVDVEISSEYYKSDSENKMFLAKIATRNMN